jgi:hypothetical protein
MRWDYGRRVLGELKLTLPVGLATFLSSVTGGAGLGTWIGKTAALIAGRDVSRWGDIGGVVGGALGLGFFIGFVGYIVIT